MADSTRLDPAGPIMARLAKLKSSADLVQLANMAGLVFDLTLAERDSYSNSTRVRAYLPRIQSALGQLDQVPSQASLSAIGRELIARGFVDEATLSHELEPTGWHWAGGQLASADRGELPDTAVAMVEAPSVRTAVVLTALPLEERAVLEHLTDVWESEHAQGTVYTCGSLAEGTVRWRVAVVTAGMGNSAAALEVERAIAHFRPEIVLLVGVAGGLKDVKLGDVVAADKVYAYEKGKAGETFAPRPESWAGGYRAIQRARREASKGNWRARIVGPAPPDQPNVLVKPIAAGEKVVSSDRADVYAQIRQIYGDAVAVEMEGAGFLLGAHANDGLVALVIRGISDLIVDKAVADSEGWQERAARHAAAFAVEFLVNYGPGPATATTSGRSAKPTAETVVAGRKKESVYDPGSSTPFFHDRMGDAFPGCEGLCVEDDPNACVARLRVLLAPPVGDRFGSPIWEIGLGTVPIRSFASDGDGIVHLDQHRYLVHRLVAYRSRRYWHNFVLLYWKGESPTGLYPPRSPEEVAECVQLMGSCREEYGVWGTELVTRTEYDDGSVFRDGRPMRISARLEVRNLADGVTFLAAQLSPLNDLRSDSRREGLLKDHMSGRASLGDIVEWVQSLPRHRRDSD